MFMYRYSTRIGTGISDLISTSHRTVWLSDEECCMKKSETEDPASTDALTRLTPDASGLSTLTLVGCSDVLDQYMYSTIPYSTST